MIKSRSLRQVVVALALLVAFLSQATWVLAGTTGRLLGQVTDDSGAPVAGAAVKVSSASETTSTTTDAGGHFTFLSLAPDTYTVSISKEGYNPTSYPGVSIFADQSQTLALRMQKGLKTIATVGARSSGNLVKSGTTASVYSVNSATQTAVQGIGGGGNLDSSYSAIYSQPGVNSQIGNYGFGQVYYIRGGSYSQIGYEYDGIPVNRAFDNYNGNSLANNGVQQTEVYTGGSPAGGTSATLGGYINQVIKTGTFPGYAQGNLGIGTPGFYSKAGVEAGGATPDRLFSWYVGVMGNNQTYNTLNNQNGSDQPTDGSGPNGIFSSYYNPMAGVFNQYGNGPYSTCSPTGTPSGAATFGLNGFPVRIPVCNAYAAWAGSGFLASPLITRDRENVFNFHFGIPHKNDAGKDDVQALYYVFAYTQDYGGFMNQQGGLPYMNGVLTGWGGANGYAEHDFGVPGNYNGANGPYGNLCAYNSVLFGPSVCATTGGSPLRYGDTVTFAPGTSFGQDAATANVVPYLAPPGTHAFQSGIAPNLSDSIVNNGSIIKLQYQKNFGSTAFLRLMGYTFYTNWLQTSPNFAGQFVTGYGYLSTGGDIVAPDYELGSHTRGIQLEGSDQLNAQNLLTFTGNYTTANTTRWNNQFYAAPSHPTNLLNAAGQCLNGYTETYTPPSGGKPITIVQGGGVSSCLLSSTAGTYGSPTSTGLPSGCNGPTPSGGYVSCTEYAPGPGQKYVVTVPQGYGTLNTVVPNFGSVALQDEFRPNDKLDLNIGVRYESYEYNLANANNPEFNFWFKQAANAYCYDPVTGQPLLVPTPPGSAPSAAGPVVAPNTVAGQNAGLCYVAGTTNPLVAPSGKQALHPNGVNGNLLYTNNGPSSFQHPEWSPRIGGTYTFNPDTVLRFSAGRYTQPTQTAFQQYLNASGLGAAKFSFQHFWGLGFTTPDHNNPVQTSNNYDLSFAQHLKGTDISYRVTPFYRWTTNQLVTISLGGNFASAINAGTQRSEGVELAVQKGDPSRNGLSGQLSYTYTNAKIRYNTLSNGTNAIDALNNYVTAYNKLTKAGGGSLYYCTNGLGPNGTNQAISSPGACKPPSSQPSLPVEAIENPYYNQPIQALEDRNGWYNVYANNPPYTSPDSVTSAALSPNVFSGFLNYKHDKFTATLTGLLNQGTAYGSPTAVIGLDPRTCVGNQSTIPGVASKYQYFGNYQTCNASSFATSGNLAIPNPVTGAFDSMGQYQEPWQLNLGLQFGYDVTPRIHVTATLANVLNTCFGGTSTQWSSAYKANSIVCSYAPNGFAYIDTQPGAGFFYGASGHDPANGTAGYPAVFNQPYQPLYGALPFQVYFDAQVKL